MHNFVLLDWTVVSLGPFYLHALFHLTLTYCSMCFADAGMYTESKACYLRTSK